MKSSLRSRLRSYMLIYIEEHRSIWTALLQFLSRQKMRAKALENVILRQYLAAMSTGSTIKAQRQIKADIINAQQQCQEVLLTVLAATDEKKVLDDKDI